MIRLFKTTAWIIVLWQVGFACGQRAYAAPPSEPDVKFKGLYPSNGTVLHCEEKFQLVAEVAFNATTSQTLQVAAFVFVNGRKLPTTKVFMTSAGSTSDDWVVSKTASSGKLVWDVKAESPEMNVELFLLWTDGKSAVGKFIQVNRHYVVKCPNPTPPCLCGY